MEEGVEMAIKKYSTKVTSFDFDPDNKVLSVEVPEQFIIDLDLHENEILEWEIDDEARVATITKTKLIINS